MRRARRARGERAGPGDHRPGRARLRDPHGAGHGRRGKGRQDAGAGRLRHELHQPRGPRHRVDAGRARGPGARHLRHPVGARPPRRRTAGPRPQPGADGLRRPQPPRVDAPGALRRARRAARDPRRRSPARPPRGGAGLRRGLGARARRGPQRVPVLLLLQPGRRAGHHRVRHHAGRLPRPHAGGVLPARRAVRPRCRRRLAGHRRAAHRVLHGRGQGAPRTSPPATGTPRPTPPTRATRGWRSASWRRSAATSGGP